MKVLVVERGIYDGRDIEAVFASWDALNAAYPGETWREERVDESDRWWDNAKDWGGALRVYEMTVRDTEGS